jgi:peptide-methionine (S)-S-oxide reductase
MPKLRHHALLFFLPVMALLALAARPTPAKRFSFPDPPLVSVATTSMRQQATGQQATGHQTAVLAGGCFWGVEAVFEHVKGVTNVVSGYSGGSASTAHYERVGTGETGHAESVEITYDPAQISYGQLLTIYFAVAHDPTQLNRQEADEGTQYRSAIFFENAEQKQLAQAYIDRLDQSRVFKTAIVTQLVPLKGFYAAEDYHQNFIDRNPNYPYVVVHDLPKLKQLRQQFADLYKL